MKNTLRLFQLLLAVYGYYVVSDYSVDHKPFIALGCVICIVILERFQDKIIELNERQKAVGDPRLKQGDRAKQQLEVLRQSRSTAVVSNAIQELMRDLGMTIRPSHSHQVIDHLVELQLPGQGSTNENDSTTEGNLGQLGLKIISDVNEPSRDWEHWQKIKTFEEEGEEQQRFLLIAHNLVKNDETGAPRYVKFSEHTTNFLTEHRVTAMTSLSFCHLYQVCKESNQNPQLIFQRLYRHQGGVFEI